MSERQSLLAAIAQSPDDDAVRLVFADWLDDYGESDRAEFIRHQVEASRRPTWCPERNWLLWRADRLLEANPGWRSGFPELEGVTWGRFERGFLAEAVVADFDALRRQADAIGQIGTVCDVAVIRAERTFPIESLPALPWLRGLRFDSRENSGWTMLGSDGVSRLAKSPLVSSITELRLDHHYVNDRALRELADSPHLGRLTSFTLIDDESGGRRGWPEFLASANAKDLRRLCLRQRGLSIQPGFRAGMARLFAEAGNLTNLESLDVSHRCVDPESLRLVFASPHLANLRELFIQHLLLDPEDMLAFPDRTAKPQLRSLDVSQNHFRRDGLAYLLDAPGLAGLERMTLADCRLTGPDGELLATASWRTTVTALDLSQNRLQAAGLRRLLAADWPLLRELRLNETGLKPAALEALVNWRGLARLRTLALQGNDLGEVAARLREAGLPADAHLV